MQKNPDALDSEARADIGAEMARYAEALRGISASDRAVFLEQTNLHLARIDKILAAHARRLTASEGPCDHRFAARARERRESI